MFIRIAILMGVVIILVSLSQAQPPDTLWTAIYGGNNDEYGASVQQTSDGGYIVAGYTYSYGAGERDVYLIKTDELGNELWYQTYGGSSNDYGFSVQQTADGGYIVAGQTMSYGVGGYDVWLIKTGASGDSLWSQTFGRGDYDCGHSVQQTADGGYIIAGYTRSYGAGFDDVYLIKTDASGDTLWTQIFGGSDYDCGYSVQQTTDDGYIVAGYTASYGAGGADVYLIKTDASGNVEWTQTYGGSGWDCGYSVQQTTDGGYIIAGAGSDDVYLIKTDASGNEEWYRIYGGWSMDCGRSVQQTDDGGYIIAGQTNSYGAGLADVYLIKADASGAEEWSQTFGGNGTDWGRSVQQTTDGGYIITGRTNSYGPGGDDVYLIRLEGDVLPPPLTVTLIPYDPPIIIPASGGSFDYNIEGENTELFMVNCDVWCDVTLPNGTIYGPVMGPVNINIPGSVAINRDRTQEVPAGAPAGIYSYNAYIGIYPDSVTDSDAFSFEKLETGDLADWINEWTNSGQPFDEWIVQSTENLPTEFAVFGAYPNPFNPSTTINFSLPQASKVHLAVYDISGRLVTTLVDDWREAGTHEVSFNGSNLPSGIYIYRLRAGDFTAIRKMILMK